MIFYIYSFLKKIRDRLISTVLAQDPLLLPSQFLIGESPISIQIQFVPVVPHFWSRAL